MQEPVIDGIGLNTTSLPDGRLDLLPAMLARWRAIGCTHVELTARRLDLVVGGRLVVARCDAVAAMVAEAGLKAVLQSKFQGPPNLQRDCRANGCLPRPPIPTSTGGSREQAPWQRPAEPWPYERQDPA